MTDVQKQKTWGELPLEIRELLSKEDTAERIETIGAKHGLPIMEQGFLVRICADLMKGALVPTEFIVTLTKELDIPREQAVLLAGDINHDIFNGVKGALQKVHAVAPSAVPKIDPSLVTCLPGNMSPAAQVGNKAPGNTVALGSIFEQKLGGAFRMKGESATVMGGPTLVTPPPPQAVAPATVAFDPYRELPH
jgi:hypothetical protein